MHLVTHEPAGGSWLSKRALVDGIAQAQCTGCSGATARCTIASRQVLTQQNVAVVDGRDVLLPVPDGAVWYSRQAAEDQQAHQPCSTNAKLAYCLVSCM